MSKNNWKLKISKNFQLYCAVEGRTYVFAPLPLLPTLRPSRDASN
jgi:hypothetical protein